MIEPTVGRVVNYHPRLNEPGFHEGPGPRAAIVAGIKGPRLVNLAVFDSHGNNYSRVDVQLLQDDDAPPPEGAAYAEWMPFQKGQAAKTEQLEQKLASSSA